MAKGDFIIRMGECMMANGNRIICMVMGNCTISPISWHMRDNGFMISSQAKVLYIMKSLSYSRESSIIAILMI